MFEGLSATTLGGLYNNCSFGKTKLTTATSAGAPVLQMPCPGTTSWGGAFTTNTCDFDDFAGWVQLWGGGHDRGEGTQLLTECVPSVDPCWLHMLAPCRPAGGPSMP